MFGLNCQTSSLSSKTTSSPSISCMKKWVNCVGKCSFNSSFYCTYTPSLSIVGSSHGLQH
jgi:hypothetical protein